MLNDHPYDDPWAHYILTSEVGQWFVCIPPGPPEETVAEEMLRAYEMAWFFVQISQGATTLIPTVAQMTETREGWGVWGPEE